MYIATHIACPRLVPMMVASTLLAGCARDVYELEIQPQGDAYHRTLTAWHEDAGDPPKVSPLHQHPDFQRGCASFGEHVEDSRANRMGDARGRSNGTGREGTKWTRSCGREAPAAATTTSCWW